MTSSSSILPVERVRIDSVHGKLSECAINYVFLWSLRGEFALTVRRKYLTLHENDVVMLQPGDEYTISAKGGNCILSMVVRRSFFAEGKVKGSGTYVCDSVSDSDRDYSSIRKMLSQMAAAYFEKDDDGGLLLWSLAYGLLYYLGRYHFVTDTGGYPHSLSDQNAERTRIIIDYIDQNYKNAISLKSLADRLYLSQQYLSRFIKRCLGQNFVSYLNQVRMAHAVDDLLDTDRTVISIAADNGFSNIGMFNKLFRETYNMTPNQYRKACGGRTASAELPDPRSRAQFEAVEQHLRSFMKQDSLPSSAIPYTAQSVFTIKNPLFGRPFEPLWNSMINIGFSDHVNHSELSAHMRLAKDEIGFRYGRLQALLNNSLLPLIPGTDDYNFAEFDRFIELMLSIEMKPFLDLTFKVSHLVGAISDNSGQYQMQQFPDNAVKLFSQKVSAIVRHCINAFGQNEVESWGIEIGYWHDEKLRMLESTAAFVSRFRDIYRFIKELLPGISIGGISHNATLPIGLLEEILGEMKKCQFAPDFVSLVLFSYNSVMPPDKNGDFIISSDPDRTLREVGHFRALFERFPGIVNRICLTVFGSDISTRNPINDSCYQSAFLVKNTVELLGKVDMLGYWQLSDICNTNFDSGRLLFGGNGIVSQHGLKKPSFFALKRLNQAGGYLVQKNDNFLVTTDCSRTVIIILYNYIHFGEQYCLRGTVADPLHEIYSAFDMPNVLDMTLKLEGLPTGQYRVTTSILNREHASVLDEWLRYGLIDKLYPRDIKYFQDITHPARQARNYVSVDGRIDIHSQLLPHEVRVIEIVHEV